MVPTLPLRECLVYGLVRALGSEEVQRLLQTLSVPQHAVLTETPKHSREGVFVGVRPVLGEVAPIVVRPFLPSELNR